MPQIHPSAIVERGAELADDVIIGPLCHVGSKVRIGAGSRLLSQATILGRTTLGQSNVLWPHAVLGGDPQDLKYQGEDSELIVGDHNEIRECATIHKGTANGGGVTRVGSHNLLMVGCHIAHDCQVGDHVILANAVQLAGHVLIEDHAAIAGASGLHHFVTVSQYAYVGGLTRIVHDVPPYMVVEGNPARVRKVNTTLLERSRFDPEEIKHLKKAFRLLYSGNDGESRTVGRTSDAVAQLDADYPDDGCVQTLLTSIRRSGFGLHGRYRESQRHDDPHTNPVR